MFYLLYIFAAEKSRQFLNLVGQPHKKTLSEQNDKSVGRGIPDAPCFTIYCFYNGAFGKPRPTKWSSNTVKIFYAGVLWIWRNSWNKNKRADI